MAARKTNNRSTNQQTSASKKRTTSSGGTKKTGTGNKNANHKPRMTKEEIAQQSAFHDELVLVLTLVVSILLVLANFGMGGFIGSRVNRLILGVFGLLAYVIPVAAFVGVAFHISNRGNYKAMKKLICGSVLLLALMALFQLFTQQYDLKLLEFYQYANDHRFGFSGGIIGGMVCKLLKTLFGVVGAYVIVIAVFLVCFMMFSGKTIITAISKRSGQSLLEMRERRRENAMLRREYEEERIEEAAKEPKEETPKRKAKTFTLQQKPYEVDQETGEIIEESVPKEEPSEESKKSKRKLQKEQKESEKVSEKSKPVVEMSEIQPNLDHLSIQGDYVSSTGEIPTYEDELNEKFGKHAYGGQAESIEMDLGNQVESMLNHPSENEVKEEESKIPSNEAEVKEEEKTTSNQLIPDHEPISTIQEYPEKDNKAVVEEETDDSYEPMDSFNDSDEMQDYEGDFRDEMPDEVIDTQTHEMKNSQEHHKKQEPSKQHANESEELVVPEQTAPPKPYVFPPVDLLAKPRKSAQGMTEKDLKDTAAKLQQTLESFGVRAQITNVTCGPAVTRYELQPEQGVKVSKITKLSDDIKLNLAATDIRIEAPISGKAAVGIEVPNKEHGSVSFRELIESKPFKEHHSDLAFAVGKDIGGQTIVSDIAKMPHLLIAGATGSGKSVCINTLIMSLLYKSSPDDVKLIMVDPKQVELSMYNGIPHLLIPVVYDAKKASAALNWAVVEMEERYHKFMEIGVRDLKSYNEKIKEVEHMNDERFKKIPQLVIIVDELADLMMEGTGDVETSICRLAQKARAAGIHLVLATQRPSVNVITGLIKANVPSRIAFAVSSAVDSRTIIDGAGAEKLLGKGDMLFFPTGYPKPVRLQGAFISDEEVTAVVDFISKENGVTSYSQEMTENITNGGASDAALRGKSEVDDYFVEAGKFIIEKDKASIGMLQRVYKIGFNRAARIMDQLCDAGVVGPEEGTKPRKVIMSMEEFDQYIEEYV